MLISALTVALVVGVALLYSETSGDPAGPVPVTVGGPAASPPIPSGFVGLSLEYFAVAPYAGANPRAVNPVLVQLIRNLAPGQSPVLRIGGESTDRTWWPVAGTARPPSVNFTITARWLEVVRSLAHAVDGRLVFGINLEANDKQLAAAEARAIVARIPRNQLEALELGNEPELYATFKWYRTPQGRKVFARRRGSWSLAAFLNDYAQLAPALAPVPLAGPATGVPKWIATIPRFLAAEPQVKLVTLHRYPLVLCFTTRRSPMFPTLAHLLADTSSSGLADSVAADVSLAHRRGLTLRIDELNSVSCKGESGVSDVFASALWALDTTFQMARVGVDGINIHTFPGARYQLFTVSRSHGRWQSVVEPEYYGFLMFAQAAPPGSRLLTIQMPGAAASAIKAWATRARDGTVRVVLINEAAGQRVVDLRAPAAHSTSGRLEQLLAPSLTARRGVTLGGQSFGTQTHTGDLAGRSRIHTVASIKGAYVVTLAPDSAAMLTIKSRPLR